MEQMLKYPQGEMNVTRELTQGKNHGTLRIYDGFDELAVLKQKDDNAYALAELWAGSKNLLEIVLQTREMLISEGKQNSLFMRQIELALKSVGWKEEKKLP